jgi:DNA-binding Lrp family transcriptional regulator
MGKSLLKPIKEGIMAETVAYVLIKADREKALEVAKKVSETGNVWWAAVVTGPYDIIAGVRVDDNDKLSSLVIKDIQKIDGVRETLTAVLTGYYVNPVKVDVVGGPP